MMDAGDLISSLHGKCLRTCVEALGEHKEGLAVAARALFVKQCIGPQAKKKLMEQDMAYHVTRHVTCMSVTDFHNKLIG